MDLRRFLELPKLPDPALTVLPDLLDLIEPAMLAVFAVAGLILLYWYSGARKY